MKYLKTYNESLERNDIMSICEKYGIESYKINSDGTVDVNGNVDLYEYFLTKLPLKFSRVTGNFNCSSNKLTSLKGCPKSVRNFYCTDNKLTSLEGCPESVENNFYCYNNNIINLKGCPDNIKRLDCYNNPVYEIWRLFTDVSKIELLNDYDPVRLINGEPTIILDRLNDFLQDIGRETVTEVKGYKII